MSDFSDRIPYTKQALNLDQQVQQLRDRGMHVPDEAAARHYLGVINYYRLAAYWLPFEADHATHQFKAGTSFDGVLDRYVFDRELRLLLIDAIERVEVALRTQFCYQMGHRYGPHVLLDASLFQPIAGKSWVYQDSCRQLQREAADSKEAFMQHLVGKYSESLPPVWATVEIMTLGQLSKWYANLKNSADRNLVARYFDLDEVNLVSFMHHLATVRNLCAHHSRVWNREFTFTFKLPRHRPKAILGSLNPAAPKKLYNTLVLLAYFLDCISPGHQWRQRLVALLAKHVIPKADLGFPARWQQLPLWR